MELFNREVFSSSPDNIISSLFKLLSLFPQTATFTSYTAWSTLASLVWNSKRTFLWLDIVLKQFSFYFDTFLKRKSSLGKMYLNQNSNFRYALQLVGICLCVADISWDMPLCGWYLSGRALVWLIFDGICLCVAHIWYVFFLTRTTLYTCLSLTIVSIQVWNIYGWIQKKDFFLHL